MTPVEWREALSRLEAYEKAFLGAAELATVLGVQKQNLSNWRARKPEALPAAIELAMGPIWTKVAVERWLKHFF